MPASGSRTSSPRSCSAGGWPPTWSSRRATSPTTSRWRRAAATATTATMNLGRAFRGRHGRAVSDLLPRPRVRSVMGRGALAAGRRAEGAWQRSIRAKSLDLMRGVLPASTLSHVGIFASGQAYEQLLLRLMASPLPEAREFGDLILTELAKVIPSFVGRIERPDRGGEWIAYLRERRLATERAVARLGLDHRRRERRAVGRAGRCRGRRGGPAGGLAVRGGGRLRDRDPRQDRCPRPAGARRADRRAGRRAAKPASPPRARLGGGALPVRDRLRLRRLPRPPAPPDADLPVAAPGAAPGRRSPRGGARRRRRAGIRAGARDLAGRVRALAGRGPEEAAPYALCLGYRIRYVLDLNAREAMHLIELRSGREEHPTYRAVAQAMYERIAAVHPAIARGHDPRGLLPRAPPGAHPGRDPHAPQASDCGPRVNLPAPGEPGSGSGAYAHIEWGRRKTHRCPPCVNGLARGERPSEGEHAPDRRGHVDGSAWPSPRPWSAPRLPRRQPTRSRGSRGTRRATGGPPQPPEAPPPQHRPARAGPPMADSRRARGEPPPPALRPSAEDSGVTVSSGRLRLGGDPGRPAQASDYRLLAQLAQASLTGDTVTWTNNGYRARGTRRHGRRPGVRDPPRRARATRTRSRAPAPSTTSARFIRS